MDASAASGLIDRRGARWRSHAGQGLAHEAVPFH